MSIVIPGLLFIHLFGVMAGLGPTFTFGRIARQGRAERAGSFATRLTHAISRELVIPLGAVVVLSGFGLIWALRLDVLSRGWLAVSIVLQLLVFGYSVLVQNRDISRILWLLDSDAGSDPAPAVTAELTTRRRRVARAGLVMKVTTTVILFLMVAKPF